MKKRIIVLRQKYMKQMIKVKLTHEHINWPFLRQTPNLSGIWGNYQFFLNQDIEECDYWIVFDAMLKTEKTICSPESIILVIGEPPGIKTYGQKFINQFPTLVSCERNIRHPNVIYSQQGQPWFIGKNYDELMSMPSPKKNKLLSIIASKTMITKGHRQRYEFASRLKDHFGDLIDWYGRGMNDFEDKWDVLAPYKYSVVIENSRHHDYLTEKIADCFLAETFPFYYGCPNTEKYFCPNSFELIDINNIEESIKRIEKCISNEQHYKEKCPKILESKNKYLQELSLFPLLVSIIERSKQMLVSQEKKMNQIHPEGYGEKVLSRLKNRITYLSEYNKFKIKSP